MSKSGNQMGRGVSQPISSSSGQYEPNDYARFAQQLADYQDRNQKSRLLPYSNDYMRNKSKG